MLPEDFADCFVSEPPTLILAVRRHEFRALVRPVPFVALPREEIERLHGAIEVLAVDLATVDRADDVSALHSHIAIHHNYSWLTFRCPDGRRTLLRSTALTTEGPAPLFLGDEVVGVAQRQAEAHLGFSDGCAVRVAGILQDFEDGRPPSVGVLSIARLTGRITMPAAECCGHMELRMTRHEFDARSQVVIDHLAAL